jgi:hypothetical protein
VCEKRFCCPSKLVKAIEKGFKALVEFIDCIHLVNLQIEKQW